MIKQGLIEEVRSLVDKYNLSKTAKQALGYKEVIEYFDGLISYEDMIEKIKRESRRYAKRQLTWFRHIQSITWLDGEKPEEMVKIICRDND